MRVKSERKRVRTNESRLVTLTFPSAGAGAASAPTLGDGTDEERWARNSDLWWGLGAWFWREEEHGGGRGGGGGVPGPKSRLCQVLPDAELAITYDTHTYGDFTSGGLTRHFSPSEGDPQLETPLARLSQRPFLFHALRKRAFMEKTVVSRSPATWFFFILAPQRV